MILSDRELELALNRSQFFLTPRPDPVAFAPTAINLRLGSEVNIWDESTLKGNASLGNKEPCFCPSVSGFNVREVINSHTTIHDLTKSPYRLCKGGFLLAWTLERLRIPHSSRLAARVEGKSSLARLGLGIHVTAPTIHAGFGVGQNADGDSLQLEIWNVGPLPIELTTGMRICQLIFEEVHGTPNQGYQGQFLGQGPTKS